MRSRLASTLALTLSLLTAAFSGCGGSDQPGGGGGDASVQGDGGIRGPRRGGTGPGQMQETDGPASVYPDGGTGPGGSDAGGRVDAPTPSDGPGRGGVDAATPDARPADAAPGGDAAVGACAPCDQLVKDYASAFNRARACSTALSNQCAQKAPDQIACSPCMAWVTSTTELDALRAKWMDAKCNACTVCPGLQRICPGLSGAAGVCNTSTAAATADSPELVRPPVLKNGTCANSPTIVNPVVFP